LTQIKNADAPPSAKPGSDINDPYVRYLTKREIAKIIGKSPRAIEYMMRARALPFVRIGRNVRFKLAAVERALDKLTVREVSLS